MNGHAKLALSGENLPIPRRPASAVLGNSLFVDVERAVLWDGDHDLAEDPASHNQPELRPQGADERQAGLAMDIGDVMYGDPGLTPQRFVAFISRGPSMQSHEDEEDHPLKHRRQSGPEPELEPRPAFRAEPSEDPERQGLSLPPVFVDDDGAQVEKRIQGEALEEDTTGRAQRPSGKHDQSKSLRSRVNAIGHGSPPPRDRSMK